MKRKMFLTILLIFIVTIAAACSGQRPVDRVPQFLDVQVEVNHEKGKVNEPITFKVTAKYGDKAVTNADEVELEIWRANDENHENIVVKQTGNGVYELEKTFAVEGTYYVYAHVTAEGMHAMPKKEFVIGQPSEPEEDGGSSSIMEDPAETE